MLTRCHFRELARIVRQIRQEERCGGNVTRELEFLLIQWLRAENPRFDENKFLEACLKEQ